MRIDGRLIGPGVFFLLLGAIPLGAREGLLEADQVAWTWRLWPLFLIAAGLGLLLRATRYRELGGILAAVLGGVILGSLLASATTGGFGALACTPTADGGRPFTATSGTFARGTGTVRLTLDCGRATIATHPGDAWEVSGSSADGTAPGVRTERDLVAVRSPAPATATAPFAASPGWVRLALVVPDATEAYDVTVNGGALDLTAGNGARELSGTIDAGALTADLTDAAALDSLALTVNAGSAGLRLPDASVRGSLTVNAGAIRLCVPPGVGLRLTTKRGGLGGNDFGARGLTERDGVWTTAGWEGAAHLIDLETTANAGGFSLDPEDGCR